MSGFSYLKLLVLLSNVTDEWQCYLFILFLTFNILHLRKLCEERISRKAVCIFHLKKVLVNHICNKNYLYTNIHSLLMHKYSCKMLYFINICFEVTK